MAANNTPKRITPTVSIITCFIFISLHHWLKNLLHKCYYTPKNHFATLLNKYFYFVVFLFICANITQLKEK